MQNKYPLWKNMLLVGLALIGLVYALPNLYSEVPALQISAMNSENLVNLDKQIERLLNEAHLPYTSLNKVDEQVEIRFSSTDTQLHARDVLKNAFKNQYTIALNLLPSTPHWLNRLAAEPMKQGLDLRGGVHFLLEVDIDSVINRRYEGLMKSIGQTLREVSVRYSGLSIKPNVGLLIHFKSEALVTKAQVVLQDKYPNLLLDVDSSNLSISLSLSPQELDSIRQNTIEQTMTILRKRVNELGVGEAVVQQQGATRVAVDLPGIQDAARAQQILGGTATLEFHLVDQDSDVSQVQKTGVVPLGSKLYMMNGYPIILKRQVVLNGDSITSATSTFDSETASPSVSIHLGGGGESFFTKVTRDNVGRRLAIVYVESKTEVSDDKSKQPIAHREEHVISAPVINSALGSQFQITGITSSKEATNLALLLRAGALPTVIYPVEERTVGPSLGKENIHRGMVSLAVGMGLILMIMLIYYRFFGLVANVALLLNLIFLCALLSMLGATLTLPGIAGIVLTVGMAVDANVLINERIREELRAGMSVQAAIYAGYERAFATILDANLTTFIVGVVLFAVGTGPVRGFAVTLTIGLLTSMITGVTYTRAIVNAIYGHRKHIKKLSIGL